MTLPRLIAACVLALVGIAAAATPRLPDGQLAFADELHRNGEAAFALLKEKRPHICRIALRPVVYDFQRRDGV